MAIRHRHEIHSERYDRGMKSSAVGLVLNFLLGVGKLAAGLLGHSQALIADAIESLGDSVGSIIVWRGLQVASQPPDQEHPYGHGKAEPIAAFLVAVLLIVAAIGIAVESVHQIVIPHRTPSPFTLAVVIGVVVVKELLFRFTSRVGQETGSNTVRTDAWHHRSDAITSGAAAIGIAVALIGGRGFEAADDWAALFASFIIVLTGWSLLRPAVNELMDQAPPYDLVAETKRVAESCRGVYQVEKLLMRKMGIYYVADMHLEVDPDMSVRESHALAHGVKEDIQRQLPQVVEVTIHVEPAWALSGGKPPDSGETGRPPSGAPS
jgi:cation diffusion facilitator family transporter